jgi:hypothetical protein
MFPSTHLPSFIQISSAVSEKQGRDARRTHGRMAARTGVKIISCHNASLDNLINFQHMFWASKHPF